MSLFIAKGSLNHLNNKGCLEGDLREVEYQSFGGNTHLEALAASKTTAAGRFLDFLSPLNTERQSRAQGPESRGSSSKSGSHTYVLTVAGWRHEAWKWPCGEMGGELGEAPVYRRDATSISPWLPCRDAGHTTLIVSRKDRCLYLM